MKEFGKSVQIPQSCHWSQMICFIRCRDPKKRGITLLIINQNVLGLCCCLSLVICTSVKPKFHLPRHVSTRHDSTRSTCRAHAFLLCRTCRTTRLDTTRRARLARHARYVELDWLDTFDTTSATGATCNLVCSVICIKLWYVSYSLIY